MTSDTTLDCLRGCPTFVPRIVTLSSMTALCLASAPSFAAQAATSTRLHDCTNGSDGSDPSDPLIRDAAGHLIGLILGGGGSNEGVVIGLSPPGAKGRP